MNFVNRVTAHLKSLNQRLVKTNEAINDLEVLKVDQSKEIDETKKVLKEIS